jgi:hypothetical protein
MRLFTFYSRALPRMFLTVGSKSGVSLPVVFRPQRDQVFRSFAIELACLRFATSGVSLFYSGVLNACFISLLFLISL